MGFVSVHLNLRCLYYYFLLKSRILVNGCFGTVSLKKIDTNHMGVLKVFNM